MFQVQRTLLKYKDPGLLVRQFSSTPAVSKLSDIFISNKDLGKRPSDLEIEKKGLPKNTPTLEERIRRDSNGSVFVADRKGGYYRGTGTVRDYIPKDYTLHDGVREGLKAIKEEVVKWKQETFDTEWGVPIIWPGWQLLVRISPVHTETHY